MLKLNENCQMCEDFDSVIYFDTDNDFYNFCVEPVLIPKEYTNQNGEIDQYSDFNFTSCYNDAIDRNIAFVIRDKNSQILKHNGVVSYRTISKQTQNLLPYWYEKIFNKKQIKTCDVI